MVRRLRLKPLLSPGRCSWPRRRSAWGGCWGWGWCVWRWGVGWVERVVWGWC